jgi:hypothetical protein
MFGGDFGLNVRCIIGIYIRMDKITPAQLSLSLPLVSLARGDPHVSAFFNHSSPL